MKPKVILWYKPRRDKTRDIKIYISHNGQKHYHSIKRSVLPSQFEKERVRGHEYADTINAEIIKAVSSLEQIMNANRTASIDRVLEIFKSGSNSKMTLIGFIEFYIKQCKEGQIKKRIRTIYKYSSFLKTLKSYSHVDFNDINKSFYNGFTAWLREKRGFNENSVGNAIKTLKTMLNEAVEMGFSDITEHRKKYFKKPSEETDSIYLNTDEINKIINARIPDRLFRERDRFIASYYLLLRHSDSVQIDRTRVFVQDGKYYYRYLSIKTGNESVLPIKPLVYDILKRNDFFFGATNQQANADLKDICILAKIDIPKAKQVTTHTARRSGATNLYLAGVPEKMIMDLGGWKNVHVFRKYIRVDKLENARLAAEHEFFK